ncbi:MAG: endolytic transglycosylase MltG [Clostridia bacterium]|nr:endolytic transglycosylase MltG [Clostridia bacterium]
MDEKELLTTEPEKTEPPVADVENDTSAHSEEKKAAMAHMESIFEQVSAIRGDDKAPTPAPEKTEDAPESNKTEIELITLKTLTDEEKEQKEQEQEAKRQAKNRSLIIRAVICILVAAIVIFGGYLYVDYMPKNIEGTVVVTIPQGASTDRIAEELKKSKLINSELFFKAMSRIRGMDSKYNYGKFEIDRSAGYEAIFKILSAPGNAMESVRVTIPEGYEVYKIADLLESKGLIDKDKFYYLIDNGNFDYDFVQNIPQREMRLEGYLFPDTYDFVPNDEYGIINEMLGRFEQFYLKYEIDIESSDMTMDEIITLASIIEREAGSADKKLVSSVFHNRIKSPQYPYLQSCATVQYVLKERKPVLSYEDTQIDSPYNTYINKGLPIGPIASPGEASLEAALYPENTNYYFFVLGSDGSHHFSQTYEEHLQAQN